MVVQMAANWAADLAAMWAGVWAGRMGCRSAGQWDWSAVPWAASRAGRWADLRAVCWAVLSVVSTAGLMAYRLVASSVVQWVAEWAASRVAQ